MKCCFLYVLVYKWCWITSSTFYRQYPLGSILRFQLLLLLFCLHDQYSSSDEFNGLLQDLQAPIYVLVKRSCWWPVKNVRFALVGVGYISEEHARLSGPPHRRDTLGKERFLVFCACVRWAYCGRNAVVPIPHGLSRRWYASFSCLGFSAVLMIVVYSW